MELSRIEIEEFKSNFFKLIGTDWMLITAGTQERWNTMTASWGGFGVLWSKNVNFCFIRDTRYTFEFMNSHDLYTLTFFEEKYRKALDYCGSYSGRDVDKAAETGLTPVTVDGSVSFEQARIVMVCKKLYFQDFDPANFVDPQIHSNYENKDYHRMYVGDIIACYTQ